MSGVVLMNASTKLTKSLGTPGSEPSSENLVGQMYGCEGYVFCPNRRPFVQRGERGLIVGGEGEFAPVIRPCGPIGLSDRS